MNRPPPQPTIAVTIHTQPGEPVDILAARALLEITRVLHAEGIEATRLDVEITYPE